MLKKFWKRFKDYFSYLMTVDFKELFINLVILVCIILLSSFVSAKCSSCTSSVFIILSFICRLMLLYKKQFVTLRHHRD